ncbi:hypothetical protein NHX12_004536 [Muraenolepis orangiensis]|uniref:Uncharacterized protein n=1 Tax=Muraenolepis orangiensis TaxID=630683 RepID=A0A9Q0DZ82_9TELE|nr:hypothetical protein NHX12_004536 [Muraenolepis orangiensis]
MAGRLRGGRFTPACGLRQRGKPGDGGPPVDVNVNQSGERRGAGKSPRLVHRKLSKWPIVLEQSTSNHTTCFSSVNENSHSEREVGTTTSRPIRGPRLSKPPDPSEHLITPMSGRACSKTPADDLIMFYRQRGPFHKNKESTRGKPGMERDKRWNGEYYC